MRRSIQSHRYSGLNDPVAVSETRRAKLEPVDDPCLAARGLVIGCSMSAGIWLAVLALAI